MQPTSLLWKMLEFYGTRVHHRGKRHVHKFLRSALHAQSNQDLEVVRRGLRWSLNPSDFVQTHLYWLGDYEHADLEHLAHWVPTDGVVLDIGANFGYYSIGLASKMIPSGRIYAFEPCKPTFQRLNKNIALNRLQSAIVVIPGGLSDSVGTAYLEQFDGNSGATTLTATPTGDGIDLDTLDHFCESHSLTRLDAIKIDVEGSEFRVIKGGQAALAQFQPVIMIEFNSAALLHAGSSGAELEQALRKLGYELFVAGRDRWHPFQAGQQSPEVVNVLCVPSQKVSRLPGRI